MRVHRPGCAEVCERQRGAPETWLSSLSHDRPRIASRLAGRRFQSAVLTRRSGALSDRDGDGGPPNCRGDLAHRLAESGSGHRWSFAGGIGEPVRGSTSQTHPRRGRSECVSLR